MKDLSAKIWTPDDTVSENTPTGSWFKRTIVKPKILSKFPDLVSSYVRNIWPWSEGQKENKKARTKEVKPEPFPSMEVSSDGKDMEAPSKNTLDPPTRTTRIKVRPGSKSDLDLLRRSFGAARWTYNAAIEVRRDPGMDVERRASIDLKTKKEPKTEPTWSKFLYGKVVHRDSPALADHPWLKETSSTIRYEALRDMETAMKGCWTNMGSGDIDHFALRFRSRKDKSESIYIPRKWIELKPKSIIIKFPKQKEVEMWTGKRDAELDLASDCRLQRTWTNDFHLCIPNAYTPGGLKVEKQDLETPLRVCALDPGVRTFQTAYDPSSSRAIEVGAGDMNDVFRLCYSLDGLVSKISKEAKSKRRCSLRRASKRLKYRIRALVDDLHKKTAKELAENYDLVMIPSFEVPEMVKRKKRKIRSKTVRQMLCWGHYRFRQRLIFKARQLGCKVAVVDEAYTSITCSSCGTIKWNLGDAKIYRCVNPTCGKVMDRDINGAKNIFLKNAKALGIRLGS